MLVSYHIINGVTIQKTMTWNVITVHYGSDLSLLKHHINTFYQNLINAMKNSIFLTPNLGFPFRVDFSNDNVTEAFFMCRNACGQKITTDVHKKIVCVCM
jgi:hypothetical protein